MITHIIGLIIIHFIGDFMFQSRSMGLNKGKSIMWLSMHVGVYLITLLFFGFIFGQDIIATTDGVFLIIKFCLLNATLHWITDLITSKISGFCYLKMTRYQRRKDTKKELFWQYYFWLVIGFDFTIHILTLIYTFKIFFI